MSQFPKGMSIIFNIQASEGSSLRLDLPEANDLAWNKDSDTINAISGTPDPKPEGFIPQVYAVISRPFFVVAMECMVVPNASLSPKD